MNGALDHSDQPDPDAIKMFVGQIPRSWSEKELKELFEPYGAVYQINVLRDRSQNPPQSKGTDRMGRGGLGDTQVSRWASWGLRSAERAAGRREGGLASGERLGLAAPLGSSPRRPRCCPLGQVEPERARASAQPAPLCWRVIAPGRSLSRRLLGGVAAPEEQCFSAVCVCLELTLSIATLP